MTASCLIGVTIHLGFDNLDGGKREKVAVDPVGLDMITLFHQISGWKIREILSDLPQAKKKFYMSESDGMNEKRVSQWRRWLQSAPVAAFFLLTFLFSWGVWWLVRPLVSGAGGGWRTAAHTFGLCGPTLAALVLSGFLCGWQGVGDLLKRIARWRVGFGWYLFALFSTLIIGLTAIGLHTLAGGVTPPMNRIVLAQVLLPLPAGLPEEYGWRGFALPHLLKKRSALVASFIIAFFWVVWHIPISPILKNVSFLGLFLLEVIPLSILFSWLYINSRGSILLVVFYHLVYNVVVYMLNIPGSSSLWAVYVGLNWLLAALVVARYGASHLTRQKARLESMSA
jgi:membrane protease YdiL (CAAX protease family)